MPFTTETMQRLVTELADALGLPVEDGLVRALLRYFVFTTLTDEQKAQMFDYVKHMMAKLRESIVHIGSVPEATKQIAEFKKAIGASEDLTAQKIALYMDTPQFVDIVTRACQGATFMLRTARARSGQ